jgi:predicted transposase YbfD/YdcC
LVSLFCRKHEQVLHVEKLENKKDYEGQIVEDLLEIIDLTGVIFTMDALHCKKNSKQNCVGQKPLRSKGKRQSTQIEISN